MSAPRIRVLLADDHPAVRAGIRQFLERDPSIEVIAEAGNGEEALALIAQHRPDVDVSLDHHCGSQRPAPVGLPPGGVSRPTGVFPLSKGARR